MESSENHKIDKNDMHSNTEMIYCNTDRPVPVIYRYRQGGGVKKQYTTLVISLNLTECT